MKLFKYFFVLSIVTLSGCFDTTGVVTAKGWNKANELCALNGGIENVKAEEYLGKKGQRLTIYCKNGLQGYVADPM